MNVALRSEHLNIISLCTGGAGLDLGVELAIERARIVCMVEREAFAVAHLVSAMQQGFLAHAPIWSDARTFSGNPWRGAVDGLIGGIPCQPHSLAGRKQGQHDERDLWSDARRIIVQSGAWFVAIENVGGMLSAGADEIAGAERVHRDLRKLGFEVEGGLFTAAEVRATHQRERVFILAVADRDREYGHRTRIERTGRRGQSSDGSRQVPGVGLADAFSKGLEGGDRREVRQQQPTFERGGENLADAASGRRRGEGDADQPSKLASQANVAMDRPSLFPPGPDDLDGWREALERTPGLEPAVRRVADGMAHRVDELRMLGNGVVWLQAAYAIRTLATRLAARGSAGAARLVRMMEAA